MWEEERKKKKRGGGGGGGGGWRKRKNGSKRKGGGGGLTSHNVRKREEKVCWGGGNKRRRKERGKKRGGRRKRLLPSKVDNHSHVLSTVHFCTQWKVTLHIAGHCHLAPTVHPDDSLVHVVKPLAQSSETTGAVTVCLSPTVSACDPWAWRVALETLTMVLPRLGSQRMVRTLAGECTASLSQPWGVYGEPAQLHSVWVNEVVGPDWEAVEWCAHSQGSTWHPWADHGVFGDRAAQCPDWEARGWCAHLQGECTASLSWPWGVCGDRACTVTFKINEWGCWPELGSRGWCAHSQVSARHP